MKEKIIIFIIGLLSGAIIATGAIFIYTLADNNGAQNNQSQMGGQLDGGQMGPGGQTNNGGTPPEMPNGQGNPQNSNN